MLNQQQRPRPEPEDPLPLEVGAVDRFSLVIEGAESSLAFTEAAPPTPKSNQSWRWLLIALLSCFAASGAAVGAFLWLINLPPTANCENPATVTTDRAQLYCAQTAAESGELDDILSSLDLVGSWTANHSLYQEVQPLVERWSWVVLKAAEQELRNSGLDNARALVDRIPATSLVYEEAQGALTNWNVDWQQGDAIMAQAQLALQQKDWPTASKQIMALSALKNPHWRVDQVQALSSQIRQERQAQTLVTEAIATATPGGSDRLGEAIRIASQIDSSTYARQEIQPYLNRWSDLLLKLGLDNWYASDLNQAIALGRQVGLNPDRAQAAQELVWLSESRQLAQQSLGTWRTSPDQLMQLYKAMLLANRIPTNSPYYPQAYSSLSTWQTHLDDLSQLQVAEVAGRIQNIDTLKLAIGQAANVPLGHPRRVQAQTMMAHWRLEVERLEDRPYLVNAHQLAKANTIPNLQSAIQSAQAITLNRALRSEAQSWIYVWSNQIQAIEDRPILDRARQLASGGNLAQAIAEATKVEPKRALHGEAQAAIAGWRRQIWAQEQARQRALQQAAAEREKALQLELEPEDETPEAEALAPGEIAPTPQPWAPAPESPVLPGPRLRRSPLPSRIETVPGEAAPAPQMPVMPSGVAPQSPASVTPQPAAPITIDPPPISPRTPVPASPQAPELLAPTPTIPAPPAVDLAPSPSQSNSPAPAEPEPQATEAPAPSVSSLPQPEQATRLKTTKDTELLYTGALFAGR